MIKKTKAKILEDNLYQADQAILDIVSPFTEKIRSSPVPDKIFHYTDDVGLRGILEHGTLWLTDIFSLNDPSELRHGINLTLQAIESLEGKVDSIDLFLKSFRSIVDQGLVDVTNFFVCSFSHNGDELGQWRAYANNGKGYAIGFNAAVLEQDFGKTSQANKWGCSTFPITYNDEELLGFQKKIVEVIAPHINNLKHLKLNEAEGIPYIKSLMIRLALGCINLSILFKHPAYRNEEEYRFLQLHRADDLLEGIKIRSRPNKLVRYMEYQWSSLASEALQEIIIGPAASPMEARQYISECLKIYLPAKKGISIRQSNIPYRS